MIYTCYPLESREATKYRYIIYAEKFNKFPSYTNYTRKRYLL